MEVTEQGLWQANAAEAQRALAVGKLAALAAAPDRLSPHPPPQTAAAVQDLDARLNLLALQVLHAALCHCRWRIMISSRLQSKDFTAGACVHCLHTQHTLIHGGHDLPHQL